MPFGFRRRWGAFRGKQDGKGFAPAGPPADCICPHCRLTVPHRRGIPCYRTPCPRCGSPMVRKFFSEE